MYFWVPIRANKIIHVIPLAYDRKVLAGWEYARDVSLLFVVALPFFFITPDMLPITPGTVQEAGECCLKTWLLQGVQKSLLIVWPWYIYLLSSPCPHWLRISIGQDFPQFT